MSETEKFVGKIQLRPRLENEKDKDYFERVTGCNWQKYDYEPDSINEAIYDNNLSYFEAERGQKGYICLNKNIYEFLELEERDTEESYCNLEKIQDDTYKFIAQYYNGGCSLDEILADEMRRMTNKINGIDVSESVSTATNNDVYYSQKAVDELLNKIKRLQEENKELKEKQIINDIDKLDGMVKIKGKCGYEFIGGCRELKKYKQALEEIREIINEQKPVSDKAISQSEFTFERLCNYEEKYTKIVDKINEVLNDRD